jgi:hypothetical protein
MSREADPAELVALEPDERLLSDDVGQLPESVGRPDPVPQSPSRKRIVALGATLTGLTLVAGVALIVLGIVEAVSSGGLLALAAIVAGAVLIATHWGWVHVAEFSAQSLESRRYASLLEGRRQWLRTIEPHTRWTVSTNAREDGSIAIVTTRHRPVACGQNRFTFVREEVTREVHSGDEPGATVAERAELLRRDAAERTAREKERYRLAREAYESAELAHLDEQERLAAARLASEALSERINSHLRQPPLDA